MKRTVGIIQIYVMWLIDIAILSASYMILYFIRFKEFKFDGNKGLYITILMILLMMHTLYHFASRWYKNYLKRGYFKELSAVCKCNAILALLIIVVSYIFGWAGSISRIIVLGAMLVNTVLTFVSHLIIKEIFKKVLNGDGMSTSMIIVAQEGMLEETRETLLQSLEGYYRIVDEVEVNKESISDVTEKLISVAFDEVFINTPDISQRRLTPVIRKFEDMGVVTHYNLDLPDIGEASSKVGSLGDYNVITYSMVQSSATGMLIKRTMDIIGGLVGVVVTGVLLLFIAPIIKLDSKGPVFFSQTRIGKNGRRFKIYKLRSMYIDAEERKEELMKDNEMSGLMFKIEDDPRVTRVGKFIRKTSLDEFPQFLNVLKGDMSLVGTRPPTEEEFEQYSEHYRRRLSMTPGLTGMWQVSGRSDITDFDEVVKLDLQYIDNWSIGLDIKILLQTFAVVLFEKGAK